MIVLAFGYGACVAFLAYCIWDAYQRPPVDEGVRVDVRVDVHWAGVEAEWLEFVDSFGVLEEAS